MLSRINQSVTFIEETIKSIFVRQKITVQNVIGQLRAASEFAIMIHFFACLWIYIGALDDSWMTEEQRLFENNIVELYLDALYFITTTMTSVGYGDTSAFSRTDRYMTSMIAILCTQFFGLLGFAIIKD